MSRPTQVNETSGGANIVKYRPDGRSVWHRDFYHHAQSGNYLTRDISDGYAIDITDIVGNSGLVSKDVGGEFNHLVWSGYTDFNTLKSIVYSLSINDNYLLAMGDFLDYETSDWGDRKYRIYNHYGAKLHEIDYQANYKHDVSGVRYYHLGTNNTTDIYSEGLMYPSEFGSGPLNIARFAFSEKYGIINNNNEILILSDAKAPLSDSQYITLHNKLGIPKKRLIFNNIVAGGEKIPEFYYKNFLYVVSDISSSVDINTDNSISDKYYNRVQSLTGGQLSTIIIRTGGVGHKNYNNTLALISPSEAGSISQLQNNLNVAFSGLITVQGNIELTQVDFIDNGISNISGISGIQCPFIIMGSQSISGLYDNLVKIHKIDNDLNIISRSSGIADKLFVAPKINTDVELERIYVDDNNIYIYNTHNSEKRYYKFNLDYTYQHSGSYLETPTTYVRNEKLLSTDLNMNVYMGGVGLTKFDSIGNLEWHRNGFTNTSVNCCDLGIWTCGPYSGGGNSGAILLWSSSGTLEKEITHKFMWSNGSNSQNHSDGGAIMNIENLYTAVTDDNSNIYVGGPYRNKWLLVSGINYPFDQKPGT